MLRSTPNEFSVLGLGKWDYTTNTDVINNYWLDGAKRARNFESVYTMGMRGFGDCQYIFVINVNYVTDVPQCHFQRKPTSNCWKASLPIRPIS